MKKSAILFITTILIGQQALAAMDPNITEFKRWNHVMQNEQLSLPEKPFTGNLEELLSDTQYYYAYHYDYNDKDLRKWQTREEFKQHNGGACTDFAISEYYDLLEKGVNPDSMRIMILYVKSIATYHTVLVVGDYVLDIRHHDIYSLENFPSDYMPIFSLNRQGWQKEE